MTSNKSSKQHGERRECIFFTGKPIPAVNSCSRQLYFEIIFLEEKKFIAAKKLCCRLIRGIL